MTTTKLRYAFAGVGAVAYRMHKRGFADLDGIEVAAVCDVQEEAARREAAEWDCPYYLDYRQMIDETRPDVFVVTTPHIYHAEMSIYAMRAGAHVLCEKPMAIQVADADRMNAVARETGRILAVSFQYRLRPEIVAAKKLIEEGKLGKLQHVDMKIAWTRTSKYYAGWRGGWVSEGGALLMMQAPHEIDLVCHLAGMPRRVYAWTATIGHDFAAEDTVQAMLEWEGGTLGSFHASTAEAGQEMRFEIIGTRGHLQIPKGSLRFRSLGTDVIEYMKTHEKPFPDSDLIEETVELDPDLEGSHRDLHRDFYNAVAHGTPVSADGFTGIWSLEVANAMTYSSHTGQAVEFPLDRQKYAALLAELQAREASQ
jgi:predicted dehydrogenase